MTHGLIDVFGFQKG